MIYFGMRYVFTYGITYHTNTVILYRSYHTVLANKNLIMYLHSTRAKVNHVLSSREGKGGGDIDKVLGPPLRGGKRRSLGAKVNQRPIYST
jgi:hypothetical protein